MKEDLRQEPVPTRTWNKVSHVLVSSDGKVVTLNPGSREFVRRRVTKREQDTFIRL